MMRNLRSYFFWNKGDIVEYFKNKPADFRIEERLNKIAGEDRSSMKALDLGCGGGRHTEMLCKLGFQTYAVDINPQMLRCTRGRVGSSNLKVVKKASILKLPFADGVFDVIVTTGVLHQAKNLDEYDRAIRELSRVLKNSGMVYLNIFTSKTIDPTYAKSKHAFAYITKEGLDMSLLSKELFYELMLWHGLSLEEEMAEDVVRENTGERAVLRCSFKKISQ